MKCICGLEFREVLHKKYGGNYKRLLICDECTVNALSTNKDLIVRK